MEWLRKRDFDMPHPTVIRSIRDTPKSGTEVSHDRINRLHDDLGLALIMGLVNNYLDVAKRVPGRKWLAGTRFAAEVGR